MIKKTFIIWLMGLVFAASSAWGAENVQLRVNELKILPVSKIQRVAVGDPGIADVTVLNDRELMLVAKQAGTTSLIIWDGAGQRSFDLIVIEQDLKKIAQRIRELLVSSDVYDVRLKEEEENIYLIGEVFNQSDLDKIKGVLAPFPGVVNLVKVQERQPLVEIDVRVLEVGSTDVKRLGLDWSNSLPITYTEPSQIDGKLPKPWKMFRWDRTTINAKLNFLIEEDKARTLANPKLVAVSGKEASFLVGGEVPFVTVESDRGQTEVEWKDYGVNLIILPEVTSSNEIKIKLEAEISSLDSANAVTAAGYSIPAVSTREVQTELILNEEDTIFIAGLIKNEDAHNVDRLPWLAKIPILGEMFKSNYFQDKTTEVVITITPRIIGERAPREYISQEMLKQEIIRQAQRHFPAFSEEDSPAAYYSHMIEDIIAGGVVYPPQARQAQEEGIVKIDLYLLSNGQLKAASIKESSGFSILDEAALAAVQQQSPYPTFPAQIEEQELRLTVPVVFKSYVKSE